MSDGADLRGHEWAARSLRRWRAAAALSAVAMLATLAWAPTTEFGREWRKTQARYNEVADKRGLAPIDVRIRQVWLASADRADRCGTCHVAAVGEAELAGVPPFEAHPPTAHPVEEFGCTYCHAGQGAATSLTDAHGEAGSWPTPIFPPRHVEAGCGACHAGVLVPLPETLEDAGALVEQYGCEQCHDVATEDAPTLVGIALRGIPDDWIGLHGGLSPRDGDTRPVPDADDDERFVLDAWLAMKIGAPRLARGKSLFLGLGCLGCHRRGALGGDLGPDLTHVGSKDARGVAVEGASGPETHPTWLQEHFLDPQALVPGSRMPALDVESLERSEDVDDLVTYMLSLRDDVVPENLSPADRARARYGLGRGVPTSGRGLYVALCSGCHGLEGGGLEMPVLGLVTPMIATRGVLSTVTPRYIAATIRRGRRGRFMPAFGPEDGGLTQAEIASITEWIWEQGFEPRPYRAPERESSIELGADVFEQRCGACHVAVPGVARFGRELLAAGALGPFEDAVLWDAVQRGWVEQGMPSFAFLSDEEMHGLLAFLRSRAGPPLPSRPNVTADSSRAFAGRDMWRSACASCHGEQGQGGAAPMLNASAYLAWARDDYVALRTTNHADAAAREATNSLTEPDLAALLGHVRTWSGEVNPAPALPGSPDAVTRGRTLYPSRCAECHGEAGEGGTGPSLVAADLVAVVSRPFLIMNILEGRKGTAMQAWRLAEDKPVTLQDAYDLTDYLLSFRKYGAAATVSEPAPTERTRP